MRTKSTLAFASVLLSVFAATSLPANAACKQFAFLVNDYGKEGPSNDAKRLLDKHITEWATQNNVTEYQTGKKTVTCELFLDVLLFDEYTCTARANVCWGPGVKPNNGAPSQEQAEAPADDGPAPPAPVSKAEALGIAPQPQQTAAVEAAPAAAAPPPAATAPPAEVDQEGPPVALSAPVEHVAAPPATPPAQHAVQSHEVPAAGTPVETGALQAGQALPTAANTPAPPAAPAPDKDRAAAAAAAAEAAEAAERAAIAAETAANAAKAAAAAAVAASAASKGGAVAPLQP